MLNYRKYKVWEKSHSLVLEIYKEMLSFPSEEKYNLISQIKRAALSIPTNIAEGCGRETQKEFRRFLYISSGSAHELEYLLIVSKDLGFLNPKRAVFYFDEIDQVKKMLFSLIRKVSATI